MARRSGAARKAGDRLPLRPTGRKPPALPEMPSMEAGAARSRREQRWVERAERVRDAFGLVLVLVLITYVLTSLLTNRGWSAVVLIASRPAPPRSSR